MINQNPNRYSRASDGSVEISASPKVAPLRIRLSEELELLPLLMADGVIVQLGDRYLVSPATAALIEAARERDPHYWYRVNDIIEVRAGLQARIGGAIPIIKLDISGLESAARAQEFALRTAGVTEIDWPYDDTGEVPEGVLRQINWTLAEGAERPTDRWRLTDLGMNADYSYETLKIAPPGEGGRIDYEAIGEIVRRVSERLVGLRGDFNRIGDMYFDGILPDGAGESDLIESSITAVPPQEGPDPNRQRVRKETDLLTVDSGPTDRANSGLDVVSAVAAAGGAGGTTILPNENLPAPEPTPRSRPNTIFGRALRALGRLFG